VAEEAEPIERPRVPPPPSRFLFVDVAALRAKQLRRGALPRLGAASDAPALVDMPSPKKPERVAMEEVRQGLVPYDLPDLKPPHARNEGEL
jgi:DNA-directed RNA polymerase subunit K/omega